LRGAQNNLVSLLKSGCDIRSQGVGEGLAGGCFCGGAGVTGDTPTSGVAVGVGVQVGMTMVGTGVGVTGADWRGGMRMAIEPHTILATTMTLKSQKKICCRDRFGRRMITLPACSILSSRRAIALLWRHRLYLPWQ
jgi:hypothetical protein